MQLQLVGASLVVETSMGELSLNQTVDLLELTSGAFVKEINELNRMPVLDVWKGESLI